ncbi:MAG: hypothetical protein JXR96_17715 [Deltaproteobacteria bacterium]|nr:hypothetical protein [Deltaproteobacteria bacterium]
MALDEPKDDDERFEFDSLEIRIDALLLQKTGGVCVDYVEQGFMRGYRVDPKIPLAGAGAGCAGCECG